VSRDAEDALPPRRPRPRPKPPSEDEGPSTFRPAPAGGSKPARERKEPRPESGGPGFFERVFFGTVSTGHLATFCRQAAQYLSAGVDLNKSLSSLQKQFASTALGPAIDRVGQAVRRGETLSDSMAREPQVFDTFFLSLMRVAEARGGVPETLRRLADHYETRQRLIRQARSALIYPVSVVLVAAVVIWLLTVFILPALIGTLKDMTRGRTAELPLPTRLLMAFSAFMQWVGWWAVPLAVVAGLFLLNRFYKTPPGKATLDRFLLAVPVIGTLLRKIDIARLSSTLGALLDGGVDYGEALNLSADVMRMDPLRQSVRDARVKVMAGTELSTALDDSRRFPPEVISVIETGEESGKLPESLAKLAHSFEEQVEYMVKNLGSLIQPLLVIVLGGFVLFIALAFVMAYISVLASASHM
jgi:type II secretory pathway component PulF